MVYGNQIKAACALKKVKIKDVAEKINECGINCTAKSLSKAINTDIGCIQEYQILSQQRTRHFKATYYGNTIRRRMARVLRICRKVHRRGA